MQHEIMGMLPGVLASHHGNNVEVIDLSQWIGLGQTNAEDAR